MIHEFGLAFIACFLLVEFLADGFTDSSPEHPALFSHHSDNSALIGSKHYSLFLGKKPTSEKNRLTLPAWPVPLSQTDGSHFLHGMYILAHNV